MKQHSKKRIVFVDNKENVIYPQSTIRLDKIQILQQATAAKMSGRKVEISKHLIRNQKLMQNDVEIKYGFDCSIIGVVEAFDIHKNDIRLTISIPSINIDNNPMKIWFMHSDAQVVDIYGTFNDLQELNIKTVDDTKQEIQKIAEIKNSEDMALYAVIEEKLEQEEIDDVVSNGYSDLTLFTINDENSEFETTTNIENILTKQPFNSDFANDNSNIKIIEFDSTSQLVDHMKKLFSENDEIESNDNDSTLIQFERKPSFTSSITEQPKKEKSWQSYNEDSHVMIDMETLSTEPDAAIVEISLAQFNPRSGKIFKELKVKFDIDDVLKSGYDVSKSTLIDFWLNQPEEVRKDVLIDNNNRRSLLNGWSEVCHFIESIDNPFVWGKGPTFDIAKAAYAIKQEVSTTLPWKYYNERCVRSILAIDPKLAKSVVFEGAKHESMNDVKHQIKQVSIVINKHL